MDVFGKLNEFLNKGEESFKYDSSELEDMDDSIAKENRINITEEKPKSQEKCGQEELKPRRSKRGLQKNSQSTDDILDLTSGYEFGPTRSAKSRKKLADELNVEIREEIDLSEIVSPVILPSTTTNKRGGKKARAPRKVSYKKALEIMRAPLPEIIHYDERPSTSSTSKSSPQKSCATSTAPSPQRNDGAIDLTGDIEMTDKHNKNPLFQKVEVPKEKKKNYIQSSTIDLEEDIDMITVNIKIEGKIRKYPIKSQQRFYDLFKMIADDEDVAVCNVICFLGEKKIYPENTPDEINHRVSNIYTCSLLSTANFIASKKDMLELKFQSDKWKKPIALKVSRFEPFLAHVNELCKQVNFKPEQFSLKFDGDDVDLKKSPIELEFEGGEIIDCRVKV